MVLGGGVKWTGNVSWIDLLAITCGMSFAGNNLVFRARQDIPVASKTAVMLFGSAVMGIPLLLAGVQHWPEASAAGWAGALAYGVVWLLLANLATQFGVTHMEAGRASIIIILELVVAVTTAMVLGGERMSAAELAGGLSILAAAFIEARRASMQN